MFSNNVFFFRQLLPHTTRGIDIQVSGGKFSYFIEKNFINQNLS